VDGSDNVQPERWQQIINFIKRTVGAFHVSPLATHFSMVTFGGTPKVNFYFNTLRGDRLNSQGVLKLVENAKLVGGRPKIDRGLQLAYKDVFTTGNGMRKYAVKVSHNHNHYDYE
jgi:hypothetical protein